jgi:hypothetical protein
MWKKLVYAAVILLGVSVALLGGLYFLFTSWFNPAPPSNDLPKPSNALEAQRQDLDQFKRMVALDRSYTMLDRERANRAIDALRARTTVLSWGEFRVALMRIAAMADNGHTGVIIGDGPRPNAVPLRVTGFSDGLYVLRAQPADTDLLGARVEAVDGHSVQEVLAKLDALHGGVPAFRRIVSELWMQSPAVLNGIGIAPKPDLTVWTLRLVNGTVVTRALKGEPVLKPRTFEDETRWLSPERPVNEPAGWSALLPDSASLPLALRDFNKTFRREWIAGTCVLYIQMKQIDDGPDQKIGDWLRETEQAMRANKPCALIVDLRYNGGGDYTNTWSFTHKLPELLNAGARVYILTGPQTFSAAISTTAFIKETLGSRAVILGEPVGDRLKFLSEGNSGCLPNSKICFHYSTGMANLSAPCTDWRVCFWLNWLYPVRVNSLQPDEVITVNFADYLAKRDPVFDRALVLAARSGAIIRPQHLN